MDLLNNTERGKNMSSSKTVWPTSYCLIPDQKSAKENIKKVNKFEKQWFKIQYEKKIKSKKIIGRLEG